ncbi:MAG: flagellar hook-length control protein FliK, partial [Deltaproteobacteria bacterium]|nr:flagellar hook-length control protein FliK [Deltaproteobacteria bacterium]
NRENGILWLQEQARQNQSVNLRLDESTATASASTAVEDEASSLTAAAEKKRNELFPLAAEAYVVGREKAKTGGGQAGNHEIGAGGGVAGKDTPVKNAAAPSRAPSLPVSDENLLDQIKNGLTRGIQGRQTVTIRLWPENLGKVDVRLVLKEQQMTATFTVEQAEVKEALLRKVEGLRDSLGLRGIEVKDIEVRVATVKSGDGPGLSLQDQNRGHADFRHRRDQEAFTQTGAGARGSSASANAGEASSGRVAWGHPLSGLTDASGSLYIMA